MGMRDRSPQNLDSLQAFLNTHAFDFGGCNHGFRVAVISVNGKAMNFAANVQEHATPLAGAGVETGVEVHVTGDVADSAASGGCCASPC